MGDANSDAITAKEKSEHQQEVKEIAESLPMALVISTGKVWKP